MVLINSFANASYRPRERVILMEWGENVTFCCDHSKIIELPCFLTFTVIRAKVVGKKLLRDGPFGMMRYTVKQMKVRASIHPTAELDQ